MPATLSPARPLRQVYDDPRGRLDYGGRSLYRVTLADRTDDPERISVALHTEFRRILRQAVEMLLPASRAGGPPPYERLAGGERDRLYLDLLGLFPSLPHRSFRAVEGDLARSFAPRLSETLKNALDHEGEFPHVSLLARVTVVGLYLPALVRGVLEEKRLLPEDPAAVKLRAGLCPLVSSALRAVLRAPEFAVAQRARIGEDPCPMLSEEAGIFVLTDLEPTAQAVAQVLSWPNAYGQSGDTARLISAVLREAAEAGLLEGEGTISDWMAEPSNAGEIAGDPRLLADLAGRLVARRAELSAAVILADRVARLRFLLRSVLSKGDFRPHTLALYADPTGLEPLLFSRSERQQWLSRLRPELADYFDPFARSLAESADEMGASRRGKAMAASLAAMLPGLFRLHAERALYAQMQGIRRGVELLMPGLATPAELADGIRNRTLYIFSGTGPIFPLEAEAPPFVLAGDLRDFTPLTERLGTASTGSYLSRFFNDLHALAVAEGASVLNFAGDAIYCASSGRGSGARALRLLSRMEELLRTFRDAAREIGDPVVEMGLAMDAGSYFSFSVGPWRPAIGRHLNTVSRLMGTAREVALFLEDFAWEAVEVDEEEFLDAVHRAHDVDAVLRLLRPSPHPELTERIAREIGDPEKYVLRDELFGLRDLREFVTRHFLRRKPEPFLPRVFVKDSLLHNKGIVVTVEAFRRLRREIKLVSQQVYYTEEESRRVNRYFDPAARKNRPAPTISDHRELSWFLDEKSRSYRVFAALPPVALKGLADPVELVELLPASSFLTRRILPAAAGGAGS